VAPASAVMGALEAPVAVRVLDLDVPLHDLRLPCPPLGDDYRSLLALVRIAGQPIGMATFPVGADGCVSKNQLVRGLRRQLDAVASHAYAGHDSPRRVGPKPRPHNGTGNGELARFPSVSVVIPTCCNPGPLERCVRSVIGSEYGEFEVIVVENRPGPSTNTARMLASRFRGVPRLRYVEEPCPSASRARNAGLAAARGEIVAFTDDDVIVDPLWLQVCVEDLLSAQGIGCVTGLIVPLQLDSESQLLLEQFAGFGKGFERKTYRLPESRRENPLLPYAAGALGSGASIVMPAAVGRELGGFDPALGPATAATGGEDLDLLVRVLRHGYGIVYEPKAMVWHEHPGGRARLRRQAYRYGVGLGAMLSKQMLRGPQRLDLVRVLPAGLRYLRDPSSRKNEGKTRNFPRHLTWLERLGMVVGPFAYLLSLMSVRPDRSAVTASPGAPAGHAVKRVVVGDCTSRSTSPNKHSRRLVRIGQSGNAAASAVEPAQIRFAWRPTHRVVAAASPDLFVLGTAVLCALAALAVIVNAPPGVRAPLVLAMLCVAPGTAWCSAVRGRLEPGLVLGISVAAAGVIAQAMLWTDAWSPRPWLYAVAGACLVPLATRLSRTGVDWRGTRCGACLPAVGGLHRWPSQPALISLW
jgi:GT2 family glycosyltransferase